MGLCNLSKQFLFWNKINVILIVFLSCVLSEDTSLFAAESKNDQIIKKISIGNNHLLMLDEEGSIWSAGSGMFGEFSPMMNKVVENNPLATNIMAISAGEVHSLALTSEGSILEWGYDSRPTQIISNLKKVVDIAAGYEMNLALAENGDLWSWGTFSNIEPLGQLASVKLADVVDIAVNTDAAYAVRKDGTLWAWGDDNSSYQLGSRDIDPYTSNIPRKISIPKGITKVFAGKGYAMAIDIDQNVWAWGRNDFGQLGDGTLIDQYIPQKVKSLNSITQLALGDTYVLALEDSGTVLSWGDNTYGTLGDGTTTDQLKPTILSGLSNIKYIEAGNSTSMAVSNSNQAYIWGNNLLERFPKALEKPKLIEVTVLKGKEESIEAPTGLNLKALSSSSVRLMWNKPKTPSTGLGGFIVYQNGLKIAETNDETFIIKGLNPNEEYKFIVKATNSNKKKFSKNSETVTKKPVKKEKSSYVYNSSGQLKSIMYESGKIVNYEYDKNGNLKKTTVVNP
ncbi:hypothetical protein CXK86_19690 [Paenibacillus sp. BGI2013]|nr:hypothetical protein CXK86_19690 [Paenibacillus sp. BGI2013]